MCSVSPFCVGVEFGAVLGVVACAAAMATMTIFGKTMSSGGYILGAGAFWSGGDQILALGVVVPVGVSRHFGAVRSELCPVSAALRGFSTDRVISWSSEA